MQIGMEWKGWEIEMRVYHNHYQIFSSCSSLACKVRYFLTVTANTCTIVSNGRGDVERGPRSQQGK
jgi:hypothetical protein